MFKLTSIETRGPAARLRSWPALFQARISDYFAMTKPGIAAAVLVTALCGYLAGLPGASSMTGLTHPSAFNPLRLLHTLFGTALAAMGAGMLNMLLEMEPDALMDRTRNRPLPAGRVRPEEAFFLGVVLSSAGIVHLAGAVNLGAAFTAAMTLVLYLVFYTPMKKTSAFCTVVGAVSGALPPLIGWSAARGAIDWTGAGLFLILFVWQFPHLLALSWLYREDYARAGFKMMPIPDRSGSVTSRSAFVLSLALVPCSLAPYWAGVSGKAYLYSALALGSAFVLFSLQFMRLKSAASARALFLASVFYVPLLLGMMVMGR